MKTEKRNIIRLNLQHFAEDAPPSTPPATPPAQADTPPNYEETIKTDKALQSFLDSKVKTATAAALSEYEEKQRVLSDEKATEAQKLAKMNETEKHAYELKKAQEEIERYKLQDSVRGLKEEALKTASTKGIPASLVDLIPFGSVKAEEVNTIIDSLKATYDGAVKDGIAQALNGAGAPKGAGGAAKPQTSSFMQAITENQAKRD